MEKKQLLDAFFISWIILSGICLLTIAIPFIFHVDTITSVVPKCEWKTKYNKECPLCGMTTSFINISNCDFLKARKSNSFSLYLYSMFVINGIAAIIVLFRIMLHKFILHSQSKLIKKQNGR